MAAAVATMAHLPQVCDDDGVADWRQRDNVDLFIHLHIIILVHYDACKETGFKLDQPHLSNISTPNGRT